MYLEVETEQKLSNVKAISDAGDQIKTAFSQIRGEFEDHLVAINENTNEIQTIHHYLSELDAKMNRLAERMDQMQLFLQAEKGYDREKMPEYDIRPLSKREQDIFLVLYTLEERGHVTYKSLARATGLSEDIIANYVGGMVEKGVPILKRYHSGIPHLALEQNFKRRQAKENILKLTQAPLGCFC
ncbi:TPA: hypothetical protein HA361_02900 [Candidatus Woesearchaeota archaeon]|nr:hypothetical protein [Candidatus Woesearchaeota archaeon]HII68671.1 hypothetical protein [Candidatus Woesearchaeota archaeon]